MTTDRWADRPMFALDADVTVYWPDVRPCYEDDSRSSALDEDGEKQ
jgi:hypothetical protein